MGATVRGVVLAGGAASNALTRGGHRSMPSVPLASSLLLVDVPIGNCLRAGINKVYVLTQFQQQSLTAHLTAAYPPSRFGVPDAQTWVEPLAAQQTPVSPGGGAAWYAGSADAVRKCAGDLRDEWRGGLTPARDYVLLSGSAVFAVDLGRVLAAHRAADADVTILSHEVSPAEAPSKGIVAAHPATGRVLAYAEKPPAAALPALRAGGRAPGGAAAAAPLLANMGVYVFRREALFDLLEGGDPATMSHVGAHVIPAAVAAGLRVHAVRHDGYWKDVSTLRAYYDANLAMAAPDAPAALAELRSVATRGAALPPAHMVGAVTVDGSLVDDGAVLVDCAVRNSVIGRCVHVGAGSVVEDSLLLGSAGPAWASARGRAAAEAAGERVFGVGARCTLRGVIVDEDATVGDGCVITNAAGVRELDRAESHGYMIQDGIVVIMKDARIPAGTVI
jgi:glucose-1-phosphate adenylyltransferase